MNVFYNHWAGLSIQLDRSHVVRRIQYIDPLGNFQIENEQLRRIARSFEIACGQNVRIVRLTLLRQTDRFSSGALTVENLIHAGKQELASELADEAVTRQR